MSSSSRAFIAQVRIEPGIPKLLVKINPTDAESFHARVAVLQGFRDGFCEC